MQSYNPRMQSICTASKMSELFYMNYNFVNSSYEIS